MTTKPADYDASQTTASATQYVRVECPDCKRLQADLAALLAERDAVRAVLESLSTPHCILCGCQTHLDDCVIGEALAAQERKP